MLIKSEIKDLADKLAEKGILIRNFSGDLEQCYRITVGNRKENMILIEYLKEIVNDEKI